MSDTVVFAIGIVIFAITVYGSVIAGGLALTRKNVSKNPRLRRRVDEDELEKRLPTNMKY